MNEQEEENVEEKDPTFTVYLQWVYEEGLTLQQAQARVNWLNKYMYVPGFSYHSDAQIGPEREQFFPPIDPVEGEPIYPFMTEDHSAGTEALAKAHEGWVPRPHMPEGTKLVWPPTDGYDAEALYDQTFTSLDEMAKDEAGASWGDEDEDGGTWGDEGWESGDGVVQMTKEEYEAFFENFEDFK